MKSCHTWFDFSADNLIIGSDYGHNDPSKEPQFVANLRMRKDVPVALIEKILCQNERAFYGL
jgi:predicted TIM-barrel fold metal-dependent hydrolase